MGGLQQKFEKGVINFTPNLLQELITERDKAKINNEKEFLFHESHVLVNYADYLIEYLQAYFKKYDRN